MKASLVLPLTESLVLCACQPAATPPSGPPSGSPAAATTGEAPGASILPQPVENYTCEGGTKLAVRLLGESAEVGVDGAEPVSLPAIGEDGTTYSDGHMTLMIVQGEMSFAAGGADAEACTPE